MVSVSSSPDLKGSEPAGGKVGSLKSGFGMLFQGNLPLKSSQAQMSSASSFLALVTELLEDNIVILWFVERSFSK